MTTSIRQQWQNSNEFLFAAVGMNVGLSNLVRFPFVVYNNGGLVFILVYVLLTAVVAVPMMYLEIFLGQFSSCAGPGAFRGFPMAKGIAWTMLYVNLSSCVSYMTTVVHSAFYLFYSFSPTLPWMSCNNSWSDAQCFIRDYRIVPCFQINATLARKYSLNNYTEKDALAVPAIGPGNSSVMVPASEYDVMRSTCLNATQTATQQFLLKKILRLTSGIEEIGALHQDVLLVIGIFWLMGFLTVVNGIRSYAKVATYTSFTTFALLLVLLLSSVVQRGSIRGLLSYFSPDWEKLLDLTTWRAASQQLLFSMGLALGTMTCYGSYKRFQWPLSMNIMTLAAADFSFSFLSGCMAFALHGHASVLYGLEIHDVVTSGYDYAFVTYPESVKQFSHPQLWCIAFYILISLLAFDGVAGFAEVAVSTLVDVYPSVQGRRLLCTVAVCSTLFALSVPAATGGGMYIINLIDSVTYLDLVPWVALAEVILIVYGYGAVRLVDDTRFMTGDTPSTYLVVCWRYVCPLALVIICLGSVTTEKNQLLQYSYPAWTGIIRLAIILSCLVVIITQVMRTYGDNHNDIYSALEPEPNYGPAEPELLARYKETLVAHNAMPSDSKMSRQHTSLSAGVYRSLPATTATSPR